MGTTLAPLLHGYRRAFRNKCRRLEQRIQEALATEVRPEGKSVALRNYLAPFDSAAVDEVRRTLVDLEISSDPGGMTLYVRAKRPAGSGAVKFSLEAP